MPFDALFVPAALRVAVSDEAWLQAMLEGERALASAQARIGLLTQGEADAVARACRGTFDVEALADAGRRAGNPVEPLVRSLRATGARVHHGATSQDILDTAAALVARDVLGLLDAELAGLADACAGLADAHRTTVMAGRTLLQQATPTTFGLKAAGWLVAVVQARTRLAETQLPAQLGGAAGTLAAFGDRGLELLSAFADELGLTEPTLPWHTSRVAVSELAAAVAIAAGVAEKIALDVALLAQTEVGELRAAAGGGSTTMPHKRNPVGSTLARACAMRARAAAGVLIAALVQEHERAAGAWHAEWNALSEVLSQGGGALAWMRETLAGLEVDTERMRRNVVAETLSEADRLGMAAASPDEYLGVAPALVDRALEFYRR